MKCENGCGKEATYINWKGQHKCSKVPARCPAVMAKMQKTSIERYGVPNASSNAQIKQKRREIMIERYGVENPSHMVEVKEIISTKQKEVWEERREQKDYNSEGLTYIEYRHRSHQYADTQYRLYKEQLDPQGKRGKHYHLDHIYSVVEGWNNEVPVNIISDVTNLRMISDRENYRKHMKSDKSLEALYEDFNKNR